MVIIMNGVSIGVRVAAPTLKVLPTYETSVNVDIRQTNGAEFLEIEIESSTVYLDFRVRRRRGVKSFDCIPYQDKDQRA